MALEIERKFLIEKSLLKLELKDCLQYEIEQGYIWVGKPTIRIRKATHKLKGAVRYEYSMTVKGPGKLSREEYNIPITDGKYLALSGAVEHAVEKTRYLIDFKGHVWELDHFHAWDAFMVEIELESEDEAFDKPDWVGEEVTMKKGYSSSAIAQHGFPGKKFVDE